MIEGLVSVIVPVYNVEKYLNRCISSILNQTYTKIEIILVDDGSTDNCPQLCDDWRKRDYRIKVIHKKNAGSGHARNSGLEIAKGEYILFVDSDDYIEPITIEECYYFAKRNNLNVVMYGYDRVTIEGKVVSKSVPCPPISIFSDEDIVNKLMPKAISYDLKSRDDWGISLSTCFSMFSFEKIRKEKWKFVSEREIISEDFYSYLCLFGKLEKVGIINKVFYHYTINPISQSHVFKEERFEKVKQFYKQMKTLCESEGYSQYLDFEIETMFLNFVIGVFKHIVLANMKYLEKREYIKEIVDDSTLKEVLEMYNMEGEKNLKKILWINVRKQNIFMCYLLVNTRILKEKIKTWI